LLHGAEELFAQHRGVRPDHRVDTALWTHSGALTAVFADPFFDLACRVHLAAVEAPGQLAGSQYCLVAGAQLVSVPQFLLAVAAFLRHGSLRVRGCSRSCSRLSVGPSGIKPAGTRSSRVTKTSEPKTMPLHRNLHHTVSSTRRLEVQADLGRVETSTRALQ